MLFFIKTFGIFKKKSYLCGLNYAVNFTIMKTIVKKSIVLTILLSLFLAPNAWAAVGDTFTSTYQNNTLKYTVIDATNNYVSVGASDEYMDDGSTPKYPIKSTLVIPDNVTYNDVIYTVTAIKDNAFYGCNQIISLTLPNELQSIGDYAFYGCKQIASLVFPNKLQSIGDYAFKKCTSLDTITILSDIGSIGKEAFSECKNLTTATFNGNVDTVGSNAFFTCHTLTTITFIKSVNVFSEFAFYGCTSLTDLQFLGNIGTIVKFAFYGCENLGTITFGGSVNTLQELSFYGCNNLTNIEFSSPTPPLLKNIVENINNITFTIPDVSINDYVQYWHNQELNIYEKSENIFFKEGLIYTISNNEASVRYGYSNDDTLKIADYITHKNGYQYNITSVDSAAFYKTTYSSITLGNNIRTIGIQAFARMEKMTGTVVFPKSVESIGNDAFVRNTASTYKFLSNKPPKLVDPTDKNTGIEPVYGVFSPTNSSDNDGSTRFIIPCEANAKDWEKDEWNHDFFLNFYTQDCLPLTLNYNDQYDGKETRLGKITYKRTFTPGIWETLYLPFVLDSMTVTYNGKPLDINSPWNPNDGGYFHLAVRNGDYFDYVQDGSELQGHTAYIIQFPSQAFSGVEVTFTSDGYTDINTTFDQQDATTNHNMYGNTTLQNQELNGAAYYLGNDNNFKYTESSYILKPFECYLTPIIETQAKINPRMMAVRMRPQNDVSTDIPNVDANQLSWQRNGNTLIIEAKGQPVSIYNINGALIQSFAEGQEQIIIELASGYYIINSAGTAQKIIF